MHMSYNTNLYSNSHTITRVQHTGSMPGSGMIPSTYWSHDKLLLTYLMLYNFMCFKFMLNFILAIICESYLAVTGRICLLNFLFSLSHLSRILLSCRHHQDFRGRPGVLYRHCQLSFGLFQIYTLLVAGAHAIDRCNWRAKTKACSIWRHAFDVSKHSSVPVSLQRVLGRLGFGLALVLFLFGCYFQTPFHSLIWSKGCS